jgi:hypothetical protein
VFKQIIASGVIALATFGMSAIAQTTGAPADQAPAAGVGSSPGAPSPPGAPTGGKLSARDLKAGCRTDAKSQGLKGTAFQKAVLDCVAAQRPKVAARMACRQQGTKQALAGPALKEFVKTCMSQPQQ